MTKAGSGPVYPGMTLALGAHGPAVTAVQRALGVQETSEYGPTTAATVASFQRGHGIQPTAVVGPQTWAALFAPHPETRDLHVQALTIARGYVGQHEEPPGSNRGKFVDECNRLAGVPAGSFWCLTFTFRCYHEAAKALGLPEPFPPGPARASCSALFAYAATHGLLAPSPQPGDLGLCIGGERGHYHAVLINGPVHGGRVPTVEGNSNDDGSANGWEVAKREPGRTIASMHFVRL